MKSWLLTCCSILSCFNSTLWAQADGLSKNPSVSIDNKNISSISDGNAYTRMALAFQNPPDTARPGVYWYFMDGNLNRQEMTADLESMKAAGLGNLVFLEVNVGVPRGPVDFMSESWQNLFAHAVGQAQRLGIEITLGSGPGWTGSGGPWVKPQQSMQHLVGSSIQIKGPVHFQGLLPLPSPRTPYFDTINQELKAKREAYFENVAVLAFPTPSSAQSVDDIDEKALYYRAPFTSAAGVKPFLPAPAQFPSLSQTAGIRCNSIIDLTRQMRADGTLDWQAPSGEWTVMRFVSRNNGANTRPAPQAGYGFECDKFSCDALVSHFDHYIGALLKKIGPLKSGAGLTTLHIDSWEMGAQNWTQNFREEFRKRRGYDPQPFYPAYTGLIVENLEMTERFLWDLRLTGQELVVENHAQCLKSLAGKSGLKLSIEPYDMNPAADLELGAIADVPMCEFWSKGYGFNASFSCIEAVSIAHTMGRPVVAAEAFTAQGDEGWKQNPGSMKDQGDWAFCMGINRFVYHTFAHQPLGAEYRPGMTMGPYGVHWDRGQTWWPLVGDYHRYITRCSWLLRQGTAAADILYLTPEGAPHVFQPPSSALEGNAVLPDKRGYAFDGCSPGILMERARVSDGRVAFPDGTSYAMLVMSNFQTITPRLLDKIEELVKAGATVVGNPPQKSPSLMDYPDCDQSVRTIASRLWGTLTVPAALTERQYGKGRIFWGEDLYLQNKEPAFDKCQWIWYPEGNPAQNAPVETCYFRRPILIPAGRQITTATIKITADNVFTLSVNGVKLTTGDDFRNPILVDIAKILKAGNNTVTVSVVNDGAGPNPAGLIAVVSVSYDDNTKETVLTDRNWLVSKDGKTDWKTAIEMGPAGTSPWGNLNNAMKPSIYPEYPATAALLAKMDIIPDFQADGSLRYGHRCIPDHDIYFISNRTQNKVSTQCRFRVTQGQPQLWNPITGDIRPLNDYTHDGKVTSIPLQFEAGESYFVIFSRRQDNTSVRPSRPSSNFPDYKDVAILTGPWDVAFDPKFGGPETITFDTLQDWSRHALSGIKYYSGIATYRKRFDCPANLGGSDELYLDLGTVHNLARVRLNGNDLGTVWTAPWRVRLADGLKPKDNVLEIEVANLWANRLIGDDQPENKNARRIKWDSGLLEGRVYDTGRYTFTTNGYYKAGMPLQPSGLLGPVRLLRASYFRAVPEKTQ
jgi:hypothetical protein